MAHLFNRMLAVGAGDIAHRVRVNALHDEVLDSVP